MGDPRVCPVDRESTFVDILHSAHQRLSLPRGDNTETMYGAIPSNAHHKMRQNNRYTFLWLLNNHRNLSIVGEYIQYRLGQKWRCFGKRFQAKGSSVVHSPYNTLHI